MVIFFKRGLVVMDGKVKFMRKLKTVKENVKCWNKEVFGNLEISKKEVMHRIEEIDALELQGV